MENYGKKIVLIQLNVTNFRIPANLVPVVYCTVVSEGSHDEWNFLWEKLKIENVAAVQVLIISALGCTKQTHLIEVRKNVMIDQYYFLFFQSCCNHIESILNFRNTLI